MKPGHKAKRQESIGSDNETRDNMWAGEIQSRMGENIKYQRNKDGLEGKIDHNKSIGRSLEDQNEKTKQNEMDMSIRKIY